MFLNGDQVKSHKCALICLPVYFTTARDGWSLERHFDECQHVCKVTLQCTVLWEEGWSSGQDTDLDSDSGERGSMTGSVTDFLCDSEQVTYSTFVLQFPICKTGKYAMV